MFLNRDESPFECFCGSMGDVTPTGEDHQKQHRHDDDHEFLLSTEFVQSVPKFHRAGNYFVKSAGFWMQIVIFAKI